MRSWFCAWFLLVLLGSGTARADCACSAPLVDNECAAGVVCPAPDFARLMTGLQDAEHARDVALAHNRALAAELLARLKRVEALEAAPPSPWSWALAGAGAGFVVGVVVVLAVR